MDPGTGLTILGTALGSAKLLEKLLGPTADYLGGGIASWTERSVDNVSRIFKKAAERLGDSIDTPGAVPPKLLKGILDEGSFCDDELAAEYLGGILASGRTPNGRDDRAASYVKLTGQLSTYQIRFHYVAYTEFRRHYAGSSMRPTFAEDLHKMIVHFPIEMIGQAMEFTDAEPSVDILVHCMSGLSRLDLLISNFWGGRDHVNKTGQARFPGKWKEVESDGFVICPTQFGMDYYLWGVGSSSLNVVNFLDADLTVVRVPSINIPTGSQTPTRDIPEQTIATQPSA